LAERGGKETQKYKQKHAKENKGWGGQGAEKNPSEKRIKSKEVCQLYPGRGGSEKVNGWLKGVIIKKKKMWKEGYRQEKVRSLGRCRIES